MMTTFISSAIVQLLFAATYANYEIFPENTADGFYKAEEFCQAIGGNLASIHDVETNDLITQLLKDNGAVGYGWIGFNKQTNSWTDNSLVDYNPGFIPSVHQVCTAIAITDDLNRWTQVPCTNSYAFACQIPSKQSSNSVDRITSDCSGNEIERETVTIDECQFEEFPNGPSRPYKWYCNDNNQLGTKYYTRGVDNCDGDVGLDSSPPNGCADGLIFSSTCADSSIPTPNCNHFYSFPMDTCTGTQGGKSYKFSCINDNTLSSISYEGDVCDESRIIESHETPCALEHGCYCSAPINNCETQEFIVNICGDSGEEFTTTSIVNECIYSGESGSSLYHCNENNQLVEKHFDNANCQSSPSSTEETFPKQCLLGSQVAATCGVKNQEPKTTVAIANRLCTEELQEFNVGAVYKSNGGCQEHFDQGAFIYQYKSGSTSFADCVAKCEELECKSFLFGRKGVTRENWCNIYSIQCTDNGDTDWYMFTPINNAKAICELQE